MIMEKIITKQGFDKIKEELNYLKSVKRKEIAEELKQAISFGDLSENAAYEEAKKAQGFLEGKILELEQLVKTCKIVEKNGSGWVQIGSTVLLSTDGIHETFQIVGATEANPIEGKISAESPLGKLLMDKPKGATVEIETPSGRTKYKIMQIS